jgi:pimeloyl-ACP methyl ester carboxylesterase
LGVDGAYVELLLTSKRSRKLAIENLMEKIERIIPPIIAPDGTAHYQSVTSPPDNSVALCLKVSNRVIPVVFVPGIMGSNLSHSSEEKPIWLLDSKWTIGLNWIGKSAKKRKTLLDPNKTAVCGDGKIPTGTKQSETELRRRGWGEVSSMSYGDFLVWLENALDDAQQAKTGLRADLMSSAVSDDPSVEPLTFDEVAMSYKYQFPVHAVGYNWLQSNEDSAERLERRLCAFTAYYRSIGNMCDHVIIVTHSMGGLVARYHSAYIDGKRPELGCVKRSEPITKVLGVVHGAMPATGAATAYKRMKAGTEGLAGFALGRTAAEMVPVFAQSPGALQLLPSPEYGKKWLQIKDDKQVCLYPKKDDVYEEIYTDRDNWW